jgi:phage gp36-like protein
MSSLYCTPDDLVLYAANPLALQGISTAQQLGACNAASERADSYLRGRFPLPLLSWGIDLRIMTAYIAVYLLLSARGYAPDAGADSRIQQNYYEAVGFPDRPGSGWFPGVQRQAIHPDVQFAATAPAFSLPSVRTGGPNANPIRGWTTTRSSGSGRGWC